MTKTLYLVRHAKAVKLSKTSADFHRSLSIEGISQTDLIVQFCKTNKIKPFQTWTSPSVRTLSTAINVCIGLGLDCNSILIDKNLYIENIKHYKQVVNNLDNNTNHIAIVGHNPTLHALVNYYAKQRIENMPTGTLVSLVFKTNSWQKLKKGEAEIQNIFIPKINRIENVE